MNRNNLMRAMSVLLAAWGMWWLATVPVSAQSLSYAPSGKLPKADILWQQRRPIDRIQERSAGGVGSMSGMAVDARGNVYATGYSFTGAGFECVTWKFDRDGKLIWERKYDGGRNDVGNAVAVDAKGNVYVAGFTSNATHDDYLILKYDAAGTLLWRKTYDNGGGGDDVAHGIAVDSEGNVYVTGTCWDKEQEWIRRKSEVNAGYGPPGIVIKGEDWVTLKYDSTGNVSWRRSAAGFGAAIVLSSEGHVYSVGSEGGAIKAYDPSGRLLWQKGNQLLLPDWGWGNTLAVTADSQGSIYVTGMASSRATNDFDAFLVKYGPAGGIVWRRTYTIADNDVGYDVAVDSHSQPYLIIESGFSIVLVKCNSEGKPVWSKELEGSPSALVIGPEGDIYVGGVQDGNLVIMKLRKQ